MKKRMAIIIIILVIIFGGTFVWDVMKWYFTKQYFAKFEEPPVTISTIKVAQESWHPMLSAVGTLTAINGVNVTADLSGIVMRIYFRSGQDVQEGQPLIQLDDAIDQQTLKNDQAQLVLAQLNYERQSQLYRTRATARSELDAVRANLAQAQAAVAKDQVILQKKLIKAPFAGKIGIRQIDIGQYVTPGQALVNLQALNPLYVDFTLPEQDLRDIYTAQPVEISITAYPGKIFKGQITAINSMVDINTRTIQVRAVIPNPLGNLYPGVYANVNVILPVQENVITVPQTAITYSLYGDAVYVVIEKGKDKQGKPIFMVERRFVTTGPRRGNVVAIKQGLKAGEIVVSSGELKLRSGARVIINNNIKF